jgi:hypothetical protein
VGSRLQGTAVPLFGKGNGTVFSVLPSRKHADLFMQEFGGEPMHPSERGRGKHWSQWKKGTYRPIGCHLRRIDQDVSRQNVVDEGRWCLCCRQVERLGTDDPVPIAADIIT